MFILLRDQFFETYVENQKKYIISSKSETSDDYNRTPFNLS